MANATITASAIVVNGRGSLSSVPIKRFVQDAQGVQTQVDISGWTIYFEVDGLAQPIRKLLVSDPGDAKGQRIRLTGAEVAQLATNATPFVVRNETDPLYPEVMWDGTIRCDGYKGTPDSTVG